MPNSKLIHKEFVNYTLNDAYQWAYVEFSIAPHEDLELVEQLAIEAVRGSEHWYQGTSKEPPAFWVMEMNSDSVVCWVAGWAANPAKAWMVTHDVRTALIKSFRAHGISTQMNWHSLQGSQLPVPGAA